MSLKCVIFGKGASGSSRHHGCSSAGSGRSDMGPEGENVNSKSGSILTEIFRRSNCEFKIWTNLFRWLQCWCWDLAALRWGWLRWRSGSETSFPAIRLREKSGGYIWFLCQALTQTFRILSAMPRNAMGKVNKKELLKTVFGTPTGQSWRKNTNLRKIMVQRYFKKPKTLFKLFLQVNLIT